MFQILKIVASECATSLSHSAAALAQENCQSKEYLFQDLEKILREQNEAKSAVHFSETELPTWKSRKECRKTALSDWKEGRA